MSIADQAVELVRRLERCGHRIVLAESCTGGLVSAELAKIPGVSERLCGSAVTYRCDTKIKWLGVNPEEIERHTAVSREVANAMAVGVLAKTPEATLSAAVTGHLGPDAPEGFDGVVFIAVAVRTDSGETEVQVTKHELAEQERVSRQAEAAERVIQETLRHCPA